MTGYYVVNCVYPRINNATTTVSQTNQLETSIHIFCLFSLLLPILS